MILQQVAKCLLNECKISFKIFFRELQKYIFIFYLTEVIHKIPSNFHYCLIDNTHTNMLTISKITSLSSSILRERRGDNFHSFLFLSCIYPSSISFQFLCGRSRRKKRRRGGPLPPSSDFYYSTFKYCLFLDIPFLERPTSQSAPPPLSHFLGTHISLFSVRLITLYSIFFRQSWFPLPPLPEPIPFVSLQIICVFYLFPRPYITHTLQQESTRQDRSCNYLS